MENILDDEYSSSEMYNGVLKKDRIINYALDFCIRLVLYLTYLIIYIVFFSTDHPLLYSRFWDHVFPFLMWYIINFFMYLFLEYFNKGRTIGKLMTKTKVTDNKGKSLTFKTCLRRSLMRLVPFEGVVFLFSNECPHDKYSNTMVIYDN